MSACVGVMKLETLGLFCPKFLARVRDRIRVRVRVRVNFFKLIMKRVGARK